MCILYLWGEYQEKGQCLFVLCVCVCVFASCAQCFIRIRIMHTEIFGMKRMTTESIQNNIT